MMQASPPAPRHHGLTWLLFLIALIEAAAIIAFAKDRALATLACGTVGALGASAPQPAVGAAGGLMVGAPSPDAMPSGSESASQPDSGAPASAAPAVTVTNAPVAAGSVHVQGDTNQIVDPKCVANAAASLLQASAPPTTPSCGPMKQPEALKAAEKQISQ